MNHAEHETLVFIDKFSRKHGYQPSIREIGDGTGVSSPSSVQGRLRRLREQLLVAWVPGENRTVHLTEEGRRAL